MKSTVTHISCFFVQYFVTDCYTAEYYHYVSFLGMHLDAARICHCELGWASANIADKKGWLVCGRVREYRMYCVIIA